MFRSASQRIFGALAGGLVGALAGDLGWSGEASAQAAHKPRTSRAKAALKLTCATSVPGTFAPGTFAPGTFAPGTFAPGTFAITKADHWFMDEVTRRANGHIVFETV